MLKSLLCLLAFGCSWLMLATKGQAQGITYVNAAGHYTLRLPGGWIEIPQGAIDGFMTLMPKVPGSRRPDFVAGFQLKHHLAFQYPYILIQHQHLSPPRLARLLKEYQERTVQNLNKANQAFGNWLGVTTITDGPSLDRQRNIIFMTMEMDEKEDNPVTDFLAVCPGSQGIAEIHCYSLKKEFPKYHPVFDSILDSLTYDPGFEYNESEAGWVRRPGLDWDLLKVLGLIGVPVGVIVWGLKKRFHSQRKAAIENAAADG